MIMPCVFRVPAAWVAAISLYRFHELREGERAFDRMAAREIVAEGLPRRKSLVARDVLDRAASSPHRRVHARIGVFIAHSARNFATSLPG
jgi:hypothetical protein